MSSTSGARPASLPPAVRALFASLASLVSLASLAAAPTAVRAAGPGDVDRAEIAFQLGNDDAARKDYRAALAHYFESNALAPNRAVLYNIARCYDLLGEPVEAYRYYLEHLALAQPGDKLAESSREALARLASSVALLEVASDPPGATIYLDRKELG